MDWGILPDESSSLSDVTGCDYERSSKDQSSKHQHWDDAIKEENQELFLPENEFQEGKFIFPQEDGIKVEQLEIKNEGDFLENNDVNLLEVIPLSSLENRAANPLLNEICIKGNHPQVDLLKKEWDDSSSESEKDKDSSEYYPGEESQPKAKKKAPGYSRKPPEIEVDITPLEAYEMAYSIGKLLRKAFLIGPFSQNLLDGESTSTSTEKTRRGRPK